MTLDSKSGLGANPVQFKTGFVANRFDRNRFLFKPVLCKTGLVTIPNRFSNCVRFAIPAKATRGTALRWFMAFSVDSSWGRCTPQTHRQGVSALLDPPTEGLGASIIDFRSFLAIFIGSRSSGADSRLANNATS